MQNPIRETEDAIEEPTINFSSQVLTSTGFRANISDGSMLTLGPMYEGDVIVISTSSLVTNISCHDISGQGTSIGSGPDWALSFSANQTGEKCLGTIVDGQDEIGFTMTWNYIETIPQTDDDDDDNDDGDQKDGVNDGKKGQDDDDEKGQITTVILTIVILALLVYLFVMMRTQDYSEEE